jgi:hypothetical protein
LARPRSGSTITWASCPNAEAEFWVRTVGEAEVERRGNQRLTARGHMTERELAAARLAAGESVVMQTFAT